MIKEEFYAPSLPWDRGRLARIPVTGASVKESGRDARGPRVERGGCAAGSLGARRSAGAWNI